MRRPQLWKDRSPPAAPPPTHGTPDLYDPTRILRGTDDEINIAGLILAALDMAYRYDLVPRRGPFVNTDSATARLDVALNLVAAALHEARAATRAGPGSKPPPSAVE